MTKHGTPRRLHMEHAVISRKGDTVNVEETDDYWIIPDTVVAREGVYNRALRLKEDLAKTWLLFNGIPVTHDHPHPDEEQGLVIDMRRVGGFLDNVRFRDEDGAIIADTYLLKRSVAGLDINEAMITENRRTVISIRANEAVDGSMGYFSTDEWLPGTWNGAEYDSTRRDVIPNHYAIVPRGACTNEQGCGLGRAQPGADHQHQPPNGGESPTNEVNQVTNPNQDCADKGGSPPAKPGASATPAGDQASHAKLADLETKLANQDKELTALKDRIAAADKARLDAKRAKLAKLLDQDASKVPQMDETALDLFIQREESFRGHADRTRGGAGATKSDEKEGITQIGAVYTVTDWEKTRGAAKPGVN